VVVGRAFGSHDPGPSTLDLVSSLVAKSLVWREEGLGEPRFGLLETIREFGLEQLERRGEDEAAHQAHAAYFLDFAERRQTTAFLSDDKAAFDQLEVEHANLRAALTWLSANYRPADANRLVHALNWFWYARGHLRDARPWLERAMEDDDATRVPARIQTAIVLSLLRLTEGDPEGAGNLAQRGLALARATDDALRSAQALTMLGVVATAQSDFDRAVGDLEQAVALARTVDDPRLALTMTSSALANLGVAVRGQGRIAEAAAHHAAALAGQRAVGSLRGETNSLADLADLALEAADYPTAAEHIRAALGQAREYGEEATIADMLQGMACVLAAHGQAEAAARLFGAAERRREITGLSDWLPLHHATRRRGIAAARGAASEAAFAAAWAAGRALPLDDAVAEALAHTIEATDRPAVSLTPREAEILPLLAEGMTDREIGAALVLSHRTVEHHVARLCAKLGTRTRPAALEAARAAGLLPADFAEYAND
jgi:non-specific serine/threonine protein kinase